MQAKPQKPEDIIVLSVIIRPCHLLSTTLHEGHGVPHSYALNKMQCVSGVPDQD